MPIKTRVWGISASPLRRDQFLFFLEDLVGGKLLPITVGDAMAMLFVEKLSRKSFTRPLTHKLIVDILREHGAIITEIIITRLENETFFARVVLNCRGRRVEVDARPSDASLLAMEVGLPIMVAEEVMTMAGVVPEGPPRAGVPPPRETIPGEPPITLDQLGVSIRETIKGLKLDDL